MPERTRHWKRENGKPLYCLSPFVTVFSSPNVPVILAVRYHRKQPGPYPRNTLVFISGVSSDFSLPKKRHSPFGNGLGSSAAPPVGWMLPISRLGYRLGIDVWLWGSVSGDAKRWTQYTTDLLFLTHRTSTVLRYHTGYINFVTMYSSYSVQIQNPNL